MKGGIVLCETLKNGGILINDTNEIKKILRSIEKLDEISSHIDTHLSKKESNGFAMTIRTSKVPISHCQTLEDYKNFSIDQANHDESIILVMVDINREEETVQMEVIIFAHKEQKKREESYLEIFDEILDTKNGEDFNIEIL